MLVDVVRDDDDVDDDADDDVLFCFCSNISCLFSVLLVLGGVFNDLEDLQDLNRADPCVTLPVIASSELSLQQWLLAIVPFVDSMQVIALLNDALLPLLSILLASDIFLSEMCSSFETSFCL